MNPARKYLAIIFLLLAFSGGGVFMYYALNETRQQPELATILPFTKVLPEFALVDQTGATFTRADLHGKWHVLFFGFTHCPDICPATLQQLAISRARLAEEGVAFPQIVLISVDPERDTPDVMASYVGAFGANIKGVTGDIDEIRKLTSDLGIYFEKVGDSGGDYSVDHSAAVLVIDASARWHALFSAPHSVDAFVRDLPILTGES